MTVYKTTTDLRSRLVELRNGWIIRIPRHAERFQLNEHTIHYFWGTAQNKCAFQLTRRIDNNRNNDIIKVLA